MSSFMKWALVHALHWAVLYCAFVAQVGGAMSVLKFWVWVMAPLSPLLLLEKAISDAAKKPAAPVRGWLNWLQAWATLGLLVWFGHIASGLAWGLVMAMMVVHRDATRRMRAGTATSAA